MLGTAATLRRYPVKSMLGEDVDSADVSWTGLARDRRLAVVSCTTGKIASAKYRGSGVICSPFPPPPAATLDRAVPEAVLHAGI